MSHHEEKKVEHQGSADKSKNRLNEVAGKVPNQAGKLAGNREQEIQGKAREAGSQAPGKEREIEPNFDR